MYQARVVAHVRVGEEYALEGIFRIGRQPVQLVELFRHVRGRVKQVLLPTFAIDNRDGRRFAP